ncbi:MAG: Nitrous oxide-stimulated promoter [Ignavibacteria bacterium]|nr:Nitrous oxide-stimulated promoter [Ignavibacteria bacterium]
MIELYCKLNHKTKSLCYECSELWDYASARLEKCPFGYDKPVCNQCTVHCYKKDKREEIRRVMRFSGPKMIWRSPYLAIMHFVDKKHQPVEGEKAVGV